MHTKAYVRQNRFQEGHGAAAATTRSQLARQAPAIFRGTRTANADCTSAESEDASSRRARSAGEVWCCAHRARASWEPRPFAIQTTKTSPAFRSRIPCPGNASPAAGPLPGGIRACRSSHHHRAYEKTCGRETSEPEFLDSDAGTASRLRQFRPG